MKSFDRRFGKGFHLSLPVAPGIYRFYDEGDRLIYVGKAKNLRRRISQYRNARRCKAHAKMWRILKDAIRLEFETCANEFEALSLENRWIQSHRPKWNVEGAFSFLYPYIGLQVRDRNLYLCYTSYPEKFSEGFSFHGAFRSRRLTKEAFYALKDLLALLGHLMPRGELIRNQIVSGALSRREGMAYGFRQVPEEWTRRLPAFFRGEDFSAVEELALLLLEKPDAIAQGLETQQLLHLVRSLWRHEISPLKRAREHCGWDSYPVAQRDRDRLFIALRTQESAAPESLKFQALPPVPVAETFRYWARKLPRTRSC